MNRILKSLCSLVLCFCMVCFVVQPVFADEEPHTEEMQTEDVQAGEVLTEEIGEEQTVLHIASASEFLEFAGNCRLDSYSKNLKVVLEADIDLIGVSFDCIPVFCGTFEGEGHSITGLSIEGAGSVQGLFRYLQATAVIRNLTVEGMVSPTGSRSRVGGIAGSNAGLIENCRFSGQVSGGDYVGGLVGSNEVGGIIDSCNTEGSIDGSHFVGGMAGQNQGVIRNCINNAEVNVTATQNNVELSDITIESLTDSESVNAVTDIGGIAGNSSGVIRDCTNNANVGYQHMGYNIGGIAGSQTGYIIGCTNNGQIYGRKEIGGIVGQIEPVTTLNYEEDTLQILRVQLGTMSDLVNQTSTNVQSSVDKVNLLIGELQSNVRAAEEAIDTLVPDRENPTLPDLDSYRAALNTLGSSLTGMDTAIRSLATETYDMVNTLNSDLQALMDQMNVINGTINNSSDNLGGSVTDISDSDTAEDLTAKVEACVNYGSVLADLNTGGIVGAIAFENDLDPEDDVEISGSASLNFAGEMRAVVLDCTNGGIVTVKKQNGGGIAGWMSMGLVKECLNTGEIDGASADCIGGIAGASNGCIRSCSVKCIISGADYVGGIAGSGETVTDCRSMVRLTGIEKTGAILGEAEELPNASAESPKMYANYYLVIDYDIGAIDGISYSQCAEPMERAEFLALNDLAEAFKAVTLHFIFEDGTDQTVLLATGGEISLEDIPEIPQKEGHISYWEGLDEFDFAEVAFDATFRAMYTQRKATIQSETLGSNGLPILLAQGEFSENNSILMEELNETPELEDKEVLIEAWKFTISDGTANQLRYLYEGDYESGELKLMVRDTLGSWREVTFTEDGSYLVFGVNDGDEAFSLIHVPKDYSLVLILGGGGLAIVVMLISLLIWHRKKRRARVEEATEVEKD